MGIKAQVDALAAKVESVKGIFGKDRGSDITNLLSDIDGRRDACITGIRTVAEAYTQHFDEDTAVTAKNLLQKIDSFGTGIARQNYQTETTILNKLGDSFENEPEMVIALDVLNLTAWAGKLKVENTLFNERFLDRINESAQDNDEKFTELRTDVIAAYRTLCNHLEAHATLKGIAAYAPIIDPINSLIETYNLTIKRRTQVEETV